jgi:hypothetical protein
MQRVAIGSIAIDLLHVEEPRWNIPSREPVICG